MKIRILVSANSPSDLIADAKKYLFSQIDEKQVEFVDGDPDVFYVVSGGVEGVFKRENFLKNFYPLICYAGTNAFAASIEIKAYLKKSGISVRIVKDHEILRVMSQYKDVSFGIDNIKGKTVGLIGEESDWLLNSSVAPDCAAQVLRMNLKKISWKSILGKHKKKVDQSFIDSFSKNKDKISEEELVKSSYVYSYLKETVNEFSLDAISVECFSLIPLENTTGCLALSHLNQTGIPAGCEGDLANTFSMLLIKQVCGQVPWLANIHDLQDSMVTFSHCTIHQSMLSKFKLVTHFETDSGVAVQGTLEATTVTIFRADYEQKKVFIAEGEVVPMKQHLENACRTQLQVKLSEKSALNLRENPLGNHHLVLSGNHGLKLLLASRLLGLSV